MKVKDLIEQLKEYDGEDELIVAYWDKETVVDYGSPDWPGEENLTLTDEDWSLVVERYESGEWHWQGSAGDDFVEIAREVIAEGNEE
jgi:hypothetical protein